MTTGQHPKRRETDQQAQERLEQLEQRSAAQKIVIPLDFIPAAAFPRRWRRIK